MAWYRLFLVDVLRFSEDEVRASPRARPLIAVHREVLAVKVPSWRLSLQLQGAERGMARFLVLGLNQNWEIQ